MEQRWPLSCRHQLLIVLVVHPAATAARPEVARLPCRHIISLSETIKSISYLA
jgi:hypothetical protein